MSGQAGAVLWGCSGIPRGRVEGRRAHARARARTHTHTWELVGVMRAFVQPPVPQHLTFSLHAPPMQYGDIWVFEKDVRKNGWGDGHGHGHEHKHEESAAAEHAAPAH